MSVTEKVQQMHQVWIKKTNTSGPPFKCRKGRDGVETREVILPWDKPGGLPAYWPGGVRHRGGVILVLALMLNCGNLSSRCIRERHKRRTREADSIDVRHRGGQVCISKEASVMEVERRDLATRRGFASQLIFRRSW